MSLLHDLFAPAVIGPRRAPGRAALATVVFCTACASDTLAPPRPAADASHLYWSLELDHHAVTLSTVPPYDTLRLVATARNVHGEEIIDVPEVAFTSGDLDRVQVDSDGVLHAVAPISKVAVAATLTIGDITHTDTVVVHVTSASAPPVLESISIHPAPGDSAKFSLTGTFLVPSRSLTAVAKDTAEHPITGLSVHYASLDPTTATIDPVSGKITPLHVGPVTFTASATAYGITRADTLPFTIGLPLNGLVEVRPGIGGGGDVPPVFAPTTLVVGVGADVAFTWNDVTAPPTDVTFDYPDDVKQDDLLCLFLAPVLGSAAVCGGGNIAEFPRDTSAGLNRNLRFRQFPEAGTYHYHSERYGAGGTIIVRAEPPSDALDEAESHASVVR